MSAFFSKSTEPVALVPDGAPQAPASASGEPLCALLAQARPIAWTGERLLAAEALRLLMRLDRELREARAQWNQDWFRRVMRVRPQAVLRLRRRWAKIDPTPAIPLGNLRRRYHANSAGFLHEALQRIADRVT
jgi:hypothetical protein